MPNWADTVYEIHGSKKQLDKLEKAYKAIEDSLKADYETVWLVQFIEKAFSKTITIRPSGEPRALRGDIKSIERRTDDTLMMFCNTAWDWCPEFVSILEDKDYVVYFQCAEEGECIFVTNKEDSIMGNYRVHVGYNYDDFFTLEGVIKFIKEHAAEGVTVPEIQDMKSLYKFIEEYNDLDTVIMNDEYIDVYEYEYVKY